MELKVRQSFANQQLRKMPRLCPRTPCSLHTAITRNLSLHNNNRNISQKQISARKEWPRKNGGNKMSYFKNISPKAKLHEREHKNLHIKILKRNNSKWRAKIILCRQEMWRKTFTAAKREMVARHAARQQTVVNHTQCPNGRVAKWKQQKWRRQLLPAASAITSSRIFNIVLLFTCATWRARKGAVIAIF